MEQVWIRDSSVLQGISNMIVVVNKTWNVCMAYVYTTQFSELLFSKNVGFSIIAAKQKFQLVADPL